MKRLASSQAIGQLSLLLITPLLTRLYAPSDIGVFQIAFVIGVAFGPMLTLKLDAFIPAAPTEVRIPAARLALLVTVIAGVLSFAGLLTCALLRVETTGPLVIGLGATLVASITGATVVDNSLLVASEATTRLATRNLLAGVFAAVLQVVGGFVWPSMYSLIVALVLGRFGALLITRQRRRTTTQPRMQTLAALRHIGSRNILFAIASALSAGLSPQVGLIAIGAGTGAAQAGQFALAQRASTAPAMLFSLGLSQHYAMKISKIVRDGTEGIWIATKEQIRVTWLWSILISVGIAVVGLFGFEFLFGNEWKTAGLITAILAPALGFQIALAPLGVGFALLGRQSLHFWLETAKLLTSGLALGSLIALGIHSIVVLSAAIALLMLLGHGAFFFAIRWATRRWDHEHRLVA